MEQALLELLTSHSTLALAVSDAQGHLTFSTPALEAIVGWSVDDMSEKPSASRIPLYDAGGRRPLRPEEAPLARALLGEVVIDQICTLERPDGQVVHLRCNAAPLRSDEGEIRGAVCLVQDVTPEWSGLLKQTELRDRLISTVNHELRTPMAIIMGHAELLSEAATEESLSGPVRQSVEAIARASRELADITGTINGLVDLEGATHPDSGPSDLSALVQEVAAARRPLADAAGLALHVDSDEGVKAQVDVTLVRRALVALLDNAIAFAPPRTAVTLRATAWDGLVEVHVVDQGPGIPVHDRDRLVQPFERGSLEQPSRGSQGLGLAVAQAVAAAHGGRLILDSNQPSGLVARIRLSRQDGLQTDY